MARSDTEQTSTAIGNGASCFLIAFVGFSGNKDESGSYDVIGYNFLSFPLAADTPVSIIPAVRGRIVVDP